jgi:Gpi18-like mannosyltransferase
MKLAAPDWKNDNALKAFILVFLFLFMSFTALFIPGFESDINCWRGWTKHTWQKGLRYAYGAAGNNYPPLYQYFMWAFGKLCSNLEAIDKNIGYLRSFTLLFEFLGLWYVYKWIGRNTSYVMICLFSLLNISFSYNSLFWGQVDAIMTTLVFIALYYAFYNRLVLSTVFFILALNMKLQSIVFLPTWALLYGYAFLQKKSWTTLLQSIFAFVAIQVLVLVPFMLSGSLQKVADVFFHSVDYYSVVSMNAFNFWHLITDINHFETVDKNIFIAGLSYKRTGLLLFFASSAFALWPLFKHLLLRFRKRKSNLTHEVVWLSCATVSLCFFFFNTQMHERYCHPAFLFFTAYAFYAGRFQLYALFSITYFLQLEAVLQFVPIHHGTLIFHPKFIGLLFLVILAWSFLLLYKAYGKTIDDREAEEAGIPTARGEDSLIQPLQ